MIDLQLKFALVASIAWVATRGITPANAASAHRVWLVVLLSPVLWLAGEWGFTPLVRATVRGELVPQVLVAPSSLVRSTFAFVYLSVAAVLLVRVAVGVLAVARLLRSARRLGDLERSGLPVEALSDVREASLGVPVTAGFFNQAIVLPASWRDLPPSALEAILRHETAHVRRKDGAVALLVAVIEAVFWLNPFVWIAGRQLRFFAEMACDADASSSMDGQRYASELLRLSASWRAVRRPLYAITAGADTSMGRRITLLLDDLERGWRPRWILPVLAAVLIAAVPLAGTVRLGGVSQSPEVVHDHQHRH